MNQTEITAAIVVNFRQAEEKCRLCREDDIPAMIFASVELRNAAQQLAGRSCSGIEANESGGVPEARLNFMAARQATELIPADVNLPDLENLLAATNELVKAFPV